MLIRVVERLKVYWASACKFFGISLVKDVEYERDHAVRQYLLNKNRATHYEAQAQMWKALAERHQNFLESSGTTHVGKIS